MNNCFENVKKKFGFGCMRLPLLENGDVDYAAFNKMIDTFLDAGFNYFDTAHGYLDGKSETALRDCLAARYPRESYILTNKLSYPFFNSQEDIRPFFESQLKACGVEYFDFYLMHAQNTAFFKKYKKCRAYETAFELKREGKIKHVGLSFHDKATVLDMILNEYPEIEAVQIQFNYLDYEDPSIEARLCYEVCRKHNKPVIVMEPVKGGSLVNLPDDAKAVLDGLGNGSYASYALRYAAGFDGMEMVLSGMSNMEQLEDNIKSMGNFKPLDETELKAIEKVCSVFRGLDIIPCTACRYCVSDCPMNINIPALFSCMNSKKLYSVYNAPWYYMTMTQDNGKASDCISCGKCERACPQNIEIRKHLREIAAEFEK
ncbi:MAG: aldo/keto reductase [Clostridia bacterium]|nr:aldo/keto reductase [Clostridia bacterium]